MEELLANAETGSKALISQIEYILLAGGLLAALLVVFHTTRLMPPP